MLTVILVSITAIVAGGAVFLWSSQRKKTSVSSPSQEYPQTSAQATVKPSLESSLEAITAKASAKELGLEAEKEALEIKRRAESESAKARQEMFEMEKRLSRREEQLEERLSSLEKKETDVQGQQRGISKKMQDLEKLRQDLVKKFEQVAQMSRDEAREKILANVQSKLDIAIGQKIKEAEETIKQQSDDKAKEILVEAMRRGAHDYIAETTVSIVPLADESMKGRIIGREGRNIKSFEKETGVDVILDETPDAIQISSFDSVRREVAKLALERLLADGRIQPSRIEEYVQRAKKEVDRAILKAGNQLCLDAKVFNLPERLVLTLGRFKYRSSYGQNMVSHTLEVVKIGVALAMEVGADVRTVRLACLLHDIGKVITEEEGTHVQLGVDLLRKFNLPKEVLNAVEQHHEDAPFSSMESVIVYLADAISAARPGARFEDHEAYIERIRVLEESAASFPEVHEAYAVSAGREVRVIVKSEGLSDAKVPVLARAIADKIESEQTYPGQVKVTVIKETRSVEMAR